MTLNEASKIIYDKNISELKDKNEALMTLIREYRLFAYHVLWREQINQFRIHTGTDDEYNCDFCPCAPIESCPMWNETLSYVTDDGPYDCLYWIAKEHNLNTLAADLLEYLNGDRKNESAS